MNKKLIFGILILAMVVVASSIWLYTEKQGEMYITQVWDQEHGYSLEYPGDWVHRSHCPENWEEYQLNKIPYPVELLHKGKPTRIWISVKSTNLKSLVEVKEFGYVSRESILEEKFVEINNRKAYEVIFKEYPDKKAKWVIFLANDREYTIECYTTEELYDASDEIFDHVINSFIIK